MEEEHPVARGDAPCTHVGDEARHRLAGVGRADAPYRCPEIQSRLITWRKVRQELTPHQIPSDWASSLSGLLEAMGWPGPGPPRSPFETGDRTMRKLMWGCCLICAPCLTRSYPLALRQPNKAVCSERAC